MSFILSLFGTTAVPAKTEITKMEEDFVMIDHPKTDLIQKVSAILNNPQTTRLTYPNETLQMCNQEGQSELISQMTTRTFGRSTIPPMAKFQDYLSRNFPQALQIAAVVNQVNDTSSLEMKELNVRLVQKTFGQVFFQKLGQISLTGEIFEVQDQQGESLGQCQVKRSIQVGYPSREGEVMCQVTRQFSKVQPC